MGLGLIHVHSANMPMIPKDCQRRSIAEFNERTHYPIARYLVKTMSLHYDNGVLQEQNMSQARKRQSLNLRIKPQERGLIDRAAKTLGKNRTDFMLDAARRAAEEALLDRTIITVTPKAYAEFLARLDAPPQPNERLRRTMRTSAPWK